MLGIVAVGVVRESRNYSGPFRETMYRVHCAVIFAIAQLSCETKHVCDGRTHIRTDEIAVTHSPIRATALYAVARKTRKLRYRKDDRALRTIYGCPGNFRDSLTMPTATYILWALWYRPKERW